MSLYSMKKMICVNNTLGDSTKLELYKEYEIDPYYASNSRYLISIMIDNNLNLLEPIWVDSSCFMTLEDYREYKLNTLDI